MEICEKKRMETLVASAKRLRNVSEGIKKLFTDSSEYKNEELYQKNLDILLLINEIADFLDDCAVRNIWIDTGALDQVDFIPYSFTKLNEDIETYANIAKKETDDKKFLEARRELIVSMPSFLHSRIDKLLLLSIEYDLIRGCSSTRRIDFKVDFPQVDCNSMLSYEIKNLFWSNNLYYLAHELNNNEESGYSIQQKRDLISKFGLGNIPNKIKVDINDNKPYVVKLSGKSVMFVGQRDDNFKAFLIKIVKDLYGKEALDMYEGYKNGDKYINIMDRFFNSAVTEAVIDDLKPSDDYLRIIREKIQGQEFSCWFNETLLKYLTISYLAYVNALINLKDQRIKTISDEQMGKDEEEKRWRMKIITNPNNYSDEVIKKYIKTYKMDK